MAFSTSAWTLLLSFLSFLLHLFKNVNVEKFFNLPTFKESEKEEHWAIEIVTESTVLGTFLVDNEEKFLPEAKKVEASDVVAIDVEQGQGHCIIEMTTEEFVPYLGTIFYEEPTIKAPTEPKLKTEMTLSQSPRVWPPKPFVSDRIGIMKAQWEARMSENDFANINFDIIKPPPTRSKVTKIVKKLQTKYGTQETLMNIV